MENVLFLVPFDFVHSVLRERAEKHFYPLILPLIHCVLQFHIFLQVDKNISRCSKISPFRILMFFKGVPIFHPLNPGATPWYFASSFREVSAKKILGGQRLVIMTS